MKIFNFKEFYNVISKGFITTNATQIVTVIFSPLFDEQELKDRAGTIYEVTTERSSDWSKGKKGIPETIRYAVDTDKYINNLLEYYGDGSILNEATEEILEDVATNMLALVQDSNLGDAQKQKLINHYNNNEKTEFFTFCFIYAVKNSNKNAAKQEAEFEEEPALKNIRNYNYSVKPKSLEVPEEIDEDELTYVNALLKAYNVTENVEDIEVTNLGKYEKHFVRQRKNYYLAETINRELRDTLNKDEKGIFDTVKDEIEEGVVEEYEKEHDNPVDKVNSVVSCASNVVLSENANNTAKGWIGPGEKKGVCHMLVNEERMKWVEDDE